jgi:hypothetical protein
MNETRNFGMNDLIAIDPTAFSDARDVKYLLEHFGFSEGRFIAEYPKKWVKLVHCHLDTFPTMEAKAAKEKLEKYRKSGFRFASPKADYKPDESWLGNALTARAERKLSDVIAARDNPAGQPSPDDIDEEYFSKYGSRQCEVFSTADEYAKVAYRLLAVSHEVVFVDPYIISYGERFKRVLERMAEVALLEGKCITFKIFTMEDGKSSPNQIERGAKQFFAEITASGIRVEFFVLRDIGHREADNHARFMFSIHGGIQFDHGLDEESPPRLRKIAMLDRNIHDRLCRQYLEQELPFEIVQRIELVR